MAEEPTRAGRLLLRTIGLIEKITDSICRGVHDAYAYHPPASGSRPPSSPPRRPARGLRARRAAANNGAGSVGGARVKAGLALISDGTAVVRVGDQKVTFPTTVTDAVFSADGSRIAFVNGDGNIATARPDGKGMKVLTAKAAGVVPVPPDLDGYGRRLH